MKHIKTINELYKKTYISAANKLKNWHPKRSEELKNWAEKGGIKEPIDRIFGHEFIFKGNKMFGNNELFNGRFFITNSEMRDDNEQNPTKAVNIYFKSDYNREFYISYSFIKKPGSTYNNMSVFIKKENPRDKDQSWHELNALTRFMFNNRKDAIAFRRYLIEEVAEDFSLEEYLTKSISINSLYDSSSDKTLQGKITGVKKADTKSNWDIYTKK